MTFDNESRKRPTKKYHYRTTIGGGGGGPTPPMTPTDEAVLNGSIDTMGLSAYRKWSYQYDLMRLLMREPDIRANNTVADQFYQQHEQLAVGRFAELAQMLSVSDTAVTHLYTLLDLLELSADTLSESIQKADSLLATGTLSASSAAALRQARQAWAVALGNNRNDAESAAVQIVQHRKTQYQTALTVNNSIPALAIREVNLKTVMTALLRFVVNEGFDGTDIANLEAVAAQNQLTGGDVVRTARYNLPGDCPEAQRPLSNLAPQALREVKDLTLYPVPATDLLTVQFGSISGGQWRITDLSGRVLRTGQQASGASQTTISVADLPPGAYTFSFQSADGTLNTRLFTVLSR